jgi:hypothetical protein
LLLAGSKLCACCIQSYQPVDSVYSKQIIMLFKWLDAFNLQLTPAMKALDIFYISPEDFGKLDREKISLLIQ